MSEKLYNNNNNVSLNEREAGKRETEIKTIVNAGLSKCALSEPIMGLQRAMTDSGTSRRRTHHKSQMEKFQSEKSCHSIGQLPDLVVEGDCTLKGILVELFTTSSSLVQNGAAQ